MAEYNSPTEYIQHHLTFLAKPVRDERRFWTVNWDTLIVSIVLGVLTLGFLWLGDAQGDERRAVARHRRSSSSPSTSSTTRRAACSTRICAPSRRSR